MEGKQNLSPAESMALITEVIRGTEINLKHNSFIFLLWGWLITLASLAFFALKHYTATRFYFVHFPVLAGTGIAITVWHYMQNTTVRTQTYAEYFLSKLWLVLGLCFLLIVFMNVSQGKLPFTYTMLIAGIGTVVTGLVLRFYPLIGGGIVLLLSSLASVYIDAEYMVLLQAGAMTCGYLIPGYCLKFSKV
jgi:tetrahydromethanopterin S-methyltransferase subunit E